MNTKLTPELIRATLNDFADASYHKYGSHSHAAGYMQSMLVGLIADLPKHKQAELMQQLAETASECREHLV